MVKHGPGGTEAGEVQEGTSKANGKIIIRTTAAIFLINVFAALAGIRVIL